MKNFKTKTCLILALSIFISINNANFISIAYSSIDDPYSIGVKVGDEFTWKITNCVIDWTLCDCTYKMRIVEIYNSTIRFNLKYPDEEDYRLGIYTELVGVDLMEWFPYGWVCPIPVSDYLQEHYGDILGCIVSGNRLTWQGYHGGDSLSVKTFNTKNGIMSSYKETNYLGDTVWYLKLVSSDTISGYDISLILLAISFIGIALVLLSRKVLSNGFKKISC